MDGELARPVHLKTIGLAHLATHAEPVLEQTTLSSSHGLTIVKSSPMSAPQLTAGPFQIQAEHLHI